MQIPPQLCSSRTILDRSLIALVLCTSLFAQESPQVLQNEEPADDLSLEQISAQLENPLTSLWSMTFENSFSKKGGDLIGGHTDGNVLFFQPGLPIPFGDGMTFINRPAIPLVTAAVLDPSEPDGVSRHTTGLGDIQMLSLIGPDRSQGFVWGLGGTFKFPTATSDSLGTGKWQAGPSVMLFHFQKPWTVGTLVEHWWSFAGDDARAHTNRTDIKYIARYALQNAWSVGFGPTISIDWAEDPDNRYTVPIGLGVTKTVRFGETPVKFRLEGHYNIVKPDDYGDEWRILFRFSPVISSPFRR